MSFFDEFMQMMRERDEQDKKEWHKHHCESCGFTWEHTGKMAGNKEAHTCPCGNFVSERYHGSAAVMFHGCGKPLRNAVEAVKKTVKRVAKRVKSLCTVKRKAA